VKTFVPASAQHFGFIVYCERWVRNAYIAIVTGDEPPFHVTAEQGTRRSEYTRLVTSGPYEN